MDAGQNTKMAEYEQKIVTKSPQDELDHVTESDKLPVVKGTLVTDNGA